MSLKTDIKKCYYFRFNFIGKSTIQVIGRDKTFNKIFDIKFREGGKLHDKLNQYLIERAGNITSTVEPLYEGSWRVIINEADSELE
jgi:hypothetical protein